MKQYKRQALLLVGILFFIVSCGKKDSNSTNESTEKTEILNLISGTYQKCIPSVLYSGYYSKITHLLVEDDATKTETLSANSDCSSPYYEIINKFKIIDARYTDSTKLTLEIDGQWQSQEYNFMNSYYTGLNYCGYTDWTLSVAKNLTGVSCPTLLSSDAHHTKFKDVGEDEFLIYKLNGNELSIPLGYDESGDSANERKNSKFGAIDKL